MRARVKNVKAILDELGAMSEATSPAGAALLITHARSLSDLPRLRLVAQAAGDRAHRRRQARAARWTLATRGKRRG
ncbi:MAG: hypothetical protein WDM79_08060 [Terricaulis sp.]